MLENNSESISPRGTLIPCMMRPTWLDEVIGPRMRRVMLGLLHFVINLR